MTDSETRLSIKSPRASTFGPMTTTVIQQTIATDSTPAIR